MNVILPIVIQFSLLLLNGIQINVCSAEWHFAECRVAILRHLKQAKMCHWEDRRLLVEKHLTDRHLVDTGNSENTLVDPIEKMEESNTESVRCRSTRCRSTKLFSTKRRGAIFLSPPRFKTAKFWSWENNFVFRSNSDSFFDSFSKKQFHRYLSIQLY